MIYYFIFGGKVASEYFETGGKISTKTLAEGDTLLYEYDDVKDSPIDLLCAYDGWTGFADISEKEYHKLAKRISKLPV